jgi:phage replication-related protein YjqB (UPF0714/DUF867 family)
MQDRYANFAALASSEPTSHYSITVRDIGSPVVIVAPHGGGIEPGTSEIARAVAADVFSCYLFEGKKLRGNGRLHITSANFDEPQCIALLSAATTAVSVHGENSNTEVAYIGGLNSVVVKSIQATLDHQGFVVREHPNPEMQGRNPRNICNTGRLGAGVQLELSAGLRRSFFESLARGGRKCPTPQLALFGMLVREALLRENRSQTAISPFGRSTLS